MPRLVHEKLIREKDANLYVSLPKLKTHSMSVVTLGIKNQWGFPIDRDRGPDHNYNLHPKLVDVLSHVRPDVTLIDGVEGTIYGHYPALAVADRCVRPFRVLLGGLNVVAVDIVGAGISASASKTSLICKSPWRENWRGESEGNGTSPSPEIVTATTTWTCSTSGPDTTAVNTPTTCPPNSPRTSPSSRGKRPAGRVAKTAPSPPSR